MLEARAWSGGLSALYTLSSGPGSVSFNRFRSFLVFERFSEILSLSLGVSFLSDRGRGFSKSAQQIISSPVSVTTTKLADSSS